ncbi:MULTISPECIES: helix-turn-helix domain-containing protein [Clostridium]|uniref:XRE family transcriptional regulator n=1 Tax=Clostridium carnis TaxID=1530 RepID=A0ABY6SSL9_9CLOT|nr:helix-turn-helix transcriptional regulator [Clostridium carnis]CAI3610991.1 putative transcriptional regulator, Cro/C1 HTH domain [Clostridium neonatale]CAI3630487.1 putative transcriptional regulator, Cro/C1 HTH domain [Clostridium neonatale]CAI3630996.1 putative transcriptional regulator, Cro/C1 HTH domain [Clostridium neonatale]CAI3674596.1 putative transcriptional regulator, Cro/C1 HTH domain [Clostridium neonatale]VDG71222.1 XRE family transcriptional regulator [Clostridium carnis]
MDKEKFGEFICYLRKEKGMTQKELGDKLHLTNKAISKWERGLSLPDICIIEEIAKNLDISVLELLNGEKNSESDISNEKANKIIEDTVKHSGETIKRLKRKVTILIEIIIGLLPVALTIFAVACFYLIKDEKTLDDALLTLGFIIFATIILFIEYGIPILGISLTKVLYNSKVLNYNIKAKKNICTILYVTFVIWLMASISLLISNII